MLKAVALCYNKVTLYGTLLTVDRSRTVDWSGSVCWNRSGKRSWGGSINRSGSWSVNGSWGVSWCRGRSVSRGWSGGVDGFALVLDVGDVAVLGVGPVRHDLGPAVGKGNSVLTADNAVVILS